MKRFCLRGHDTEKTGRYASDHSCCACKRVKGDERYNTLPISERRKKGERAVALNKARKNWPEIQRQRHIRRLAKTISGVPPQPPIGTGCEICGGGREGFLHLDHDHQTMRFRGWLCGPCNVGIGCLKDDFVLVDRAASYLAGKLRIPKERGSV